MGLLARVVQLKSSRVERSLEGGNAQVIKANAQGFGTIITPEVWSVAGVWAMPPDGSHGIYIPVGGSENWGVVVAQNNYLVAPPTLAKGETAIGSTTADGATLMARATFYADGKIALSNSTKDLLTLVVGLIDLVKAIVTTGSAATQVVSVASQANLESYKAQFQALLKVPV